MTISPNYSFWLIIERIKTLNLFGTNVLEFRNELDKEFYYYLKSKYSFDKQASEMFKFLENWALFMQLHLKCKGGIPRIAIESFYICNVKNLSEKDRLIATYLLIIIWKYADYIRPIFQDAMYILEYILEGDVEDFLSKLSKMNN